MIWTAVQVKPVMVNGVALTGRHLRSAPVTTIGQPADKLYASADRLQAVPPGCGGLGGLRFPT